MTAVNSVLGPGALGRAIVLLVIGVALAAGAARHAFVQSIAVRSPDLALRLAPDNARAIDAKFVGVLSQTKGQIINLPYWAELARTSLRAAPLSAEMVRILALDSSNTPALLQLSEAVSRRDAIGQMMLVETAVSANRVGEALNHYDNALSTDPDLRTVLFPILSDAIDDESIRRNLASLTGRQRAWIRDFLNFAVHNGKPGSTAALLELLERDPKTRTMALTNQAALASRLVGEGDYAAARRAAIHAMGQDAPLLDWAGFSRATWRTHVQPLTWSVIESRQIVAELQPDRSVTVATGGGETGLALYRIMTMPAGRYLFRWKASAPEGLPVAGGRWDILCFGKTGQVLTPLASIPVDIRKAGGQYARVTISPNCTAIRLGFSITTGTDGLDVGIVLRDVALIRDR